MNPTTPTAKPIQVLLVEDNPADAELARETLMESRLQLELNVAKDGEVALRTMREGDLPDLVLLDLNLPRKSGREVLAEMREDPRLRCLPVVVLTSSDAEADIVKSYELGANCYVQKPVDLSRFQEIVRGIEGFWFTIVKLPRRI